MRNTHATELLFDLSQPGRRAARFPDSDVPDQPLEEMIPDAFRRDEDGYFYHGGRADDVIISAGYTMSAVEIEDVLLKHPDVLEAAAIGVPDDTRGQIVKSFVVTNRSSNDGLAAELQEFAQVNLGRHEYPRIIEFTKELPKTPAGKVNRKVLRDQEAIARGE